MLKARLSNGPIKIAGTMSGTSLDGVDVAILETDGRKIFGFGASAYRPYGESERRVLVQALGHWDGTVPYTPLTVPANSEGSISVGERTLLKNTAWYKLNTEHRLGQ